MKKIIEEEYKIKLENLYRADKDLENKRNERREEKKE